MGSGWLPTAAQADLRPAVYLQPYSSSSSALTGGRLLVTGDGWTPGRVLSIYLGTALRETVQANDYGRFFIPFIVPADTLPGPVPVVVTDPVSATTVSRPLLVRTDWTQDGFGASHDGFNRSEVLVGPANAGTLSKKWSVPLAGTDGAPSRVTVTGLDSTTNLVLVQERAALSARRTVDGALRWRRSIPVGTVVASADGRAYLLSSAGQVLVWSIGGGETAWTQEVGEGGSISPVSITYDDGTSDTITRVYVSYNTAAGGRIAAFNAVDGRLLWKRSTTSTVGGAALDDGWVYVGTAQGKALALFGKNGGIRWTTQTSGRALGQPAVSGKTVVFGASDPPSTVGPVMPGVVGVFAFNSDTGSPLWSYDSQLGRGVVTRPAIADGTVYAGLGSADPRGSGNAVKALALATGTPRWTFSSPSTAGGGGWTDPVVANGVLYTGSCGATQKFFALAAEDGARLLDYTPSRCSTAAQVNARVYLSGVDRVEALGLPVEIAPTTSVNDGVVGSAPEQFVYSGGWQVGRPGRTFNGDDHYGAVAGSSATIRFTGVGLRYWFSSAPYLGIAGVSIDGGPETLVDTYRSQRHDQGDFWTTPELERGDHQLRIRVTGTRNPRSSGSGVTIDRIDVGH